MQAHLANPFAMLLNAEAVLHEMHHSASLERLAHQVYHPLDKITKVRTPSGAEAFDETVDAMADDPSAADLPESYADPEQLIGDEDDLADYDTRH